MASVNQITCPSSTANTGVGACNWIPSPDVYKIAIPKGTRITSANTVDFKTFIKSKLIHNDRAQRWFAIGRLTNVESSGDVVKDTAPDGSVFIAKEPTATWKYEMKGSNSCVQKNFLGFDNSQDKFDYLRYQANGFLVGQKDYNATAPNAIEMGGYQPQMVYVSPMSEATWANVANSYMEFTYLNPKKDQGNIAVVDCSNLGLESIFKTYAVQNVEFQLTAVPTSGTINLLALSGCGNSNLGLQYTTALASASLFTAVDSVTGASVSITGATINAVTGVITLVTAGSGQTLKVSLASISTLETAGIKYYETPVALSVVIP